MSTTTTTDLLPSSVPKLEASGLNWTIFKLRFQDALDAKGFWGHFDGTSVCPVTSSPPTQLQAEAVATWNKNERTAKSLLTQKIPDSALILIHSHKLVKDRWAAIVAEYSAKGVFAQTELRSQFLRSKCPEKGNIREFLDQLRVEREKLATVGVDIEEKDYRSTIISCLPPALANFASSLIAAARVNDPTKEVKPDVLISIISEEYERHATHRSNRGKGSKTDGQDEALAVMSGRDKRKPRGECWNCGEKGHYKNKCTKPPKASDKKSDSKKGSANAAVESDSDSEAGGAFYVEADYDSDSDDDLMPDLVAISDSSDESDAGDDVDGDDDWFSEVDEGDADEISSWESEELSGADGSESSSFVSVDPDSEEDTDNFVAHVGASEDAADSPRAEVYDSGTTRHISPFREDLEKFSTISPKTFRAANKQNFSAVGMGELVVNVPNGANSSKLRLTEVLYSPEVGYTLVSIGRLDENGFSANFSGGKCIITGPDGKRVGEVPKNCRGLYRVDHEPESASAAEEVLTLDQLHRRLGHISVNVAKKLATDGFVTGLRLETTSSGDDFFCESCVYAKATRKPVAKARKGERATEFGGEIHSDLWGPAPVATKGGKRYYVTFVDDNTRLTHLHLLAAKSDAPDAYKEFEAWSNTQMKKPIKTLHSDRGGEYMGKQFVLYLKSKGTDQKLTVHDTPQENGVAERRNRTIVERIRALLHSSGLPKTLWGEAARHIVWLMNRTPTKAVAGMTPYEAAFGKKPDLSNVREWGEKVWVRIEGGTKLGGRVREGRWLGIDERSNGCRVYWPDKRTVTTERNVHFDKTHASAERLEGEDWDFVDPSSDPLTSDSTTVPLPTPAPSAPAPPVLPPTPPPAPLQSEDPVEDEPTSSRRIRKPSQRIQDILAGRGVTSARRSDPQVASGVQLPTVNTTAEFEGEGTADWMMAADFVEEYAMAAEISEAEALEPRTLAEAKGRPDWPLWENAIQEELTLLKETGTYKLVDSPAGANIVGSKWVFRAKKDSAGNVVRYKARLVAQGFSQVPGVDYFDTFAPVAKLASIRTVLAMAAHLDLELHQIDIKGAYLNGELTSRERIYMKQPPGFHAPNSSGQVWHLLKTLYGLKQSARRWYHKLVEIMLGHLGFSRCDVDQAVFFRRDGKSLTVVLVHVDDCTVAASSITLIVDFKRKISEHVEITDLGELHWLLGIEIRRDRERRSIHISQRSYIDSIIRRYNFQDLKPVSTPMETHLRLSTSQSPSTTAEFAQMRDIPYHEAVGSLMYASLGTRPDISFAVQTVSRFSTKPGWAHWEAVKRIFRYLKGTSELWLSYGGTKGELTGFADADGNMAEDRHAISGYAFLLHGGAVSWSAKRQEIISLSTTESEYVAATHAAKEALWLRSLITQLFSLELSPTTLFSDNQSAIALTQDHQYHARTKHIDIRFHFIRWIVEQGSLRLVYCPTDDMVADTLTKALPSAKVKHFGSQLGLSTA